MNFYSIIYVMIDCVNYVWGCVDMWYVISFYACFI